MSSTFCPSGAGKKQPFMVQWDAMLYDTADPTMKGSERVRNVFYGRTYRRLLGRYHCLSKDYEYLPQTSKTVIRLAMIYLMIRLLSRTVSS
jgi:hypothetical protein